MKNGMLAGAGGQEHVLEINQKHRETCRFNLVGAIGLSILLSQTVPTRILMLVWLLAYQTLAP